MQDLCTTIEDSGLAIDFGKIATWLRGEDQTREEVKQTRKKFVAIWTLGRKGNSLKIIEIALNEALNLSHRDSITYDEVSLT